MRPVRTLVLPAVTLVLCLQVSGCSGGADHRKADCAKITAALRTQSRPDSDVQGIIDALRGVRPRLKDGHLAKQVDVVLDVGAKLRKNGGNETGKDFMSESETIRFTQATDDISRTCAHH